MWHWLEKLHFSRSILSCCNNLLTRFSTSGTGMHACWIHEITHYKARSTAIQNTGVPRLSIIIVALNLSRKSVVYLFSPDKIYFGLSVKSHLQVGRVPTVQTAFASRTSESARMIGAPSNNIFWWLFRKSSSKIAIFLTPLLSIASNLAYSQTIFPQGFGLQVLKSTIEITRSNWELRKKVK